METEDHFHRSHSTRASYVTLCASVCEMWTTEGNTVPHLIAVDIQGDCPQDHRFSLTTPATVNCSGYFRDSVLKTAFSWELMALLANKHVVYYNYVYSCNELRGLCTLNTYFITKLYPQLNFTIIFDAKPFEIYFHYLLSIVNLWLRQWNSPLWYNNRMLQVF